MKRLFAVLALSLTATANVTASEQSIYQLKAELTDQSGATQPFDLYRGQPTLVTMFYGSCPGVCPLLFETMQYMERSLDEKQRSRLRVLMISIDPDRDTPDALTSLAHDHHVDLKRWTLARTDAREVRKIAAVLNIQYRRLPNGDFNHSSVITLLDTEGRAITNTNHLGKPDSEFMTALQHALSRKP